MTPTPRTFGDIIEIFVELLAAAFPVVIGLAFLVFFWGLAKFIFRVGGDEKAVEDGKKLMLWGVIALTILITFMAIIRFAYDDVGFGRPFGLPRLPEA